HYNLQIKNPDIIRNIEIQVAVNNVTSRDEDNIQYLSQNDQNVVEQGIESILNSIITTSIDEEYENVTPEENVSIVFQEFSEPVTEPEKPGTSVPLWMYI